MGTDAAQAWRQYAAALLPGLRRTALLALSSNLLLETVRLLGVDGVPWRFKAPAYPLMFLLGTAVIWLVVCLIHALVARLWVTSAIILSATVVVAIADHQKVRLRREPLLPSDTEFAGNIGFVIDMVGPGVVLVLVLGGVLVACSAFAFARIAARRLPTAPRAIPRRARLTFRLLTGTTCVLSLLYLAGFNAPGNAARSAYDALGAQWRPWSQMRNYLGNGFVGGFLYNLDIPPPAPPTGYDKATMARIAERYADAAARLNATRGGSLQDVNVVLLLSESFTDPLALDGIHVAEDPIPFTRGLMARTTSGRMLAANIGGGTANMEFEALTGMSMSQLPPQIRSPYQMLVPQYATFPSAVRWFEHTGHRPIAIHPFTTEMYRRRDVYRTFGFDQFVYDATMRVTDRSGHDGFISDAAAFDELTGQLRGSAEPLFVNLVTMQNHMPYPGRYDDPVPVTGPDGQRLDDIGHYVRGLTHTDRALRELVRNLERLDEPTVVVFYGDHQPGSYPDAVFDANGAAVMHQTPFFVWASFAGRDRPQPVTSPTHFVDLVFERADAPVPPYYALLQRLRTEIPAMRRGLWFGPDSRRVSREDLTRRARQLLHDYRMVQYDLSVGERFSVEAMLGAGPH